MGSGRPAAVVVDYDDGWPRDFDTIHAHLWPATSSFAHAIEHVGSTAVPGLAAKPIIDVDVVVSEPDDLQLAIRALQSLGYEHVGDLDIPGRHAFSVLPGLPEHHLYAVVKDTPPHRDHIDLRDYLRTHSDAAQRYTTHKRSLAHLLTIDREAYLDGKAHLISHLLALARTA